MDATAQLLQQTLLLLVLPLWLLAGLGDWACHRWQRIEHSAGLKESLLHLAMIGCIGSAVLAVLFLEPNAAVLGIALLACVAHELITWWDLRYAASCRPIPIPEQWMHSLQLVLPWAAGTALALLHPAQAAAAVGLGDAVADWQLRLRQTPLPPGVVFGVMAASGLLVVLPFAEETWRCWRVRRRRRR